MEIINRNELAKQYFPLVNKIAAQINKNSGYDYNECVSAGNTGLIYAMDNYKEDEGKKKQTFTQYAAYMIRFFILNDINKHGHIIRVNQDQQRRLKESGRNVDITTSLDRSYGYDDEGKCKLECVIPGDTETSVYKDIDPSESEIWNKVYNKLNRRFNERDLDMFYSTFGINGHKEMKGKDIAVKYGISAGAVTQVRNKILAFMKADAELKGALLDILQMIG